MNDTRSAVDEMQRVCCPKQNTRVLCVDDSGDITAALRMIIDGEPGMECAGCLASADTLLDSVRRFDIDVVILDVSMQGMDPFEAMSELTAKSPKAGVIVFSAWDEADLLRRAKKSGARGLVLKGADPEVLLRAIREVAAGRKFFTVDQ